MVRMVVRSELAARARHAAPEAGALPICTTLFRLINTASAPSAINSPELSIRVHPLHNGETSRADGEKFGLRWQSATATPLFGSRPVSESGVALRFPPHSMGALSLRSLRSLAAKSLGSLICVNPVLIAPANHPSSEALRRVDANDTNSPDLSP